MGECQWENCEEIVIDDEKAEVCGRKWGQLKNSMDVTMGDRMNVNNEMIELGQSFVQVYKIDILWKKVLTKRYKNIVYCVHIEIENAVRCTRKEQWSRNEFCWLRCFFLSYVRKEWSETVLMSTAFSQEITG